MCFPEDPTFRKYFGAFYMRTYDESGDVDDQSYS